MLEYPEVLTISRQLNQNIAGKKIEKVLTPTKVHKFCWFNGEPSEYHNILKGSRVESAEGFGIYVEIKFNNGYKLCFNDGVNVRLLQSDDKLKDYQLLLKFDDGMLIVFTVAMYGGIILHNGSYDDEYYKKSKQSISVFSPDFNEFYYKMLNETNPNMSMKAFLATKQGFPGIGNGVLQDILFKAQLHPKRKISSLNEKEKETLLSVIVSVMKSMTECGGRDTEKDIFGNKGKYKVLMSKNAVNGNCPKCGGQVVKETYLGGSIYYCSSCQQ
jgi:formamidopyrimidine-DNA glycosylase